MKKVFFVPGRYGGRVPGGYAGRESCLRATMGWPEEEKLGYPYPSGFTKAKTCFTNVFNKDIDMLYLQEKLFPKLFLSQQRYRGV